jgi:hypothetical protein
MCFDLQGLLMANKSKPELLHDKARLPARSALFQKAQLQKISGPPPGDRVDVWCNVPHSGVMQMG